MKSALPISEELRREVGRRVKEAPSSAGPPETIFDHAQQDVERLINNTTYPNFLKSDMYLQYVQVSIKFMKCGTSDNIINKNNSYTSY